MTKQQTHIVIDALKTKSISVKELIKYKDLFVTLAYRDIKVRYSQTFLGIVWAFLQPAATLLILTLVFGRFVQVETGGVPYPLFSMAGISLWIYFSFVLSQSGNSIINAQDMIKKIYFPRIIIPLSKSVAGMIDLLVAISIMIILFIYYRFIPSGNVYFFPVFIFLAIITSLTAGIWLSALTIRYRDFQYIVPFIIQFGLYLTPVAYPSDLVKSFLPDWGLVLYYLNPLSGIIEGFRWSLFGGPAPHEYFWISIGVVIFLFVISLFYFNKTEREMSDLV
jgi:lipopolysaccharide transport system permease protein